MHTGMLNLLTISIHVVKPLFSIHYFVFHYLGVHMRYLLRHRNFSATCSMKPITAPKMMTPFQTFSRTPTFLFFKYLRPMSIFVEGKLT